MLTQVARATSLILSGLMAGITLRDIVSAPGVKRLPATTYVRYHQELDRDFAPAMPIFGQLMLAAGAVATVVPQRSRTRLLSVLALGCGVADIALTITQNMPLNQAIQSWAAEGPPENWADIRDQWLMKHSLRSVFAVLSFGLQIAAALQRPVNR